MTPVDPHAQVWFYVDGPLPKGPFTHDEILQKFEAGEIGAGTVVYRNGETKWLPLAKEPAFAAYFAAHPEKAKVGRWRKGWLIMLIFFLCLALYPVLSSCTVQKDDLEEEIRLAFVDLCQANDFNLQRTDVSSVRLVKQSDNRYTGEAFVTNAKGEQQAIPVSVEVSGDPLKHRSFHLTVEDKSDWLREHF